MLATFTILFNAFFDICRLRKYPQDIPQSNALFYACLVCYLLASVILALLSMPASTAIASSLIEMTLVMIFTYALLQIRARTARWLQTMTAILGTGIIINLFALPLYYASLHGNEGGVLQGVVVLFFFVLVIWNIVIMGHIFKHALEISMSIGVVIAISYLWVISAFISILFPERIT